MSKPSVARHWAVDTYAGHFEAWQIYRAGEQVITVAVGEGVPL